MSARDRLIATLVEESLGRVPRAEGSAPVPDEVTARWSVLIDSLARHLPDVHAWVEAEQREQARVEEPHGDFVRFRRAPA
jgi:hypothetical protein